MCLQHGTVPAPGSSEGRSNLELGFLSGTVNAKKTRSAPIISVSC